MDVTFLAAQQANPRAREGGAGGGPREGGFPVRAERAADVPGKRGGWR